MMRLCTCLAFLGLLPGLAAAAPNKVKSSEMMEAYSQARDVFGTALGERTWQDDPARKILWSQVAELMCLLGDAEGCLLISKEAGRSLGVYLPALVEPVEGELPDSAVASAFLVELHRESKDWGWDSSVATEGQAWLQLLQADALRWELQQNLRSRYQALIRRAAKLKGTEAFSESLAAMSLASSALDQEAVLAGAQVLLDASERHEGALSEQWKKKLGEGLTQGQRIAQILGQTDVADRFAKALAPLIPETAFGPAELDFAMAPEAEAFRSELPKAREQLAALANRCGLRSRPALVLGFLSAYAGVIGYEPEAAVQLRPLRESLSLTDPYLGSRVLALLGLDALLAGDYHQAQLDLERAARELGERNETRKLAGLMHANRAQALSAMGQHASAARVYGQAGRRLVGWPNMAMQAQLGLAHSLIFAGELKSAAAALAQAASLATKVTDAQRPALLRSLSLDRALLAVMQKDIKRAEELYARVAREALDASDVKAGAIAQTNLAELANDRGEFAEGLRHAESALKWLDRRGQADAAWQALCEKGRALAGLGKHAPARKALDEAIELVEGMRAKIGAEGARRSFAEAKTRLYGAAVSLAVDGGELARAFYLTERARGRAFLDMLAERSIRLGKPEWQAALGPARSQMLRSLPPPPERFASPTASLSAKRLNVTAVRSLSPAPREGWRSLGSVNPARVEDVQSFLAADEAMLAYFHDGRRLLAFLLTQRELRLSQSDLEQTRLASRASSLMRAVSDPRSRLGKVEKKARALHDLCFVRLEIPENIERLIVVPWGPLHQVPFGALHDGERWLVDRFELSAVPSGSALVMLRARGTKAPRPQVLALANPTTGLSALPAAEREADILGELFSRSSRIHRGAQATKQAFVAEAPGKAYIHLASHGVFLRARPMDSYLALAGVDGLKQELRATEVMGVDLSSARLVVLSACHSGELDVRAAEERLGLSRAFLHAGARSLVASLWELADEGSLGLTRSLYAEIKRGARPAAALASAQRKLKQDERFAHPFFWAALSLVGS